MTHCLYIIANIFVLILNRNNLLVWDCNHLGMQLLNVYTKVKQ